MDNFGTFFGGLIIAIIFIILLDPYFALNRLRDISDTLESINKSLKEMNKLLGENKK